MFHPMVAGVTIPIAVLLLTLRVPENPIASSDIPIREGLRVMLANGPFRRLLAGFTLSGADHPIIPVMLGDARLAGEMADLLLAEGVYVVGFSFPVVPKGMARIRTQMSAAHSDADVDRAVDAFARVGRTLGVID